MNRFQIRVPGLLAMVLSGFVAVQPATLAALSGNGTGIVPYNDCASENNGPDRISEFKKICGIREVGFALDEMLGLNRPNDGQDLFIGEQGAYTVKSRESLRLIAAKLGVSADYLIRFNLLNYRKPVAAGQTLAYDNVRIIPKKVENGILVNIPDRRLYFFRNGRLDYSAPVALGTVLKSEKFNWQTPTGRFRILAKYKDPTWYVPPSIQSEMEEMNREVITFVPPGPSNPLGRYAMKTSIPGILIHSTSKPWSINTYSSHGCVRMYPEHMEELFKRVSANEPGEIIYNPVKLAVTAKGGIFLEVQPDIYERYSDIAREVRSLILKKNLREKVDWLKVKKIVKQCDGIPHDISN